ncbi:MAG: ATP-binding protein [Chloroflexi bacterium]|nr:ATP-binding protein [Chloroflexota bacterium]
MGQIATAKNSGLALAGLVCALAVAMAVAFLAFRMPGKDVAYIALYLLISGAISLALGFGASQLGLRSRLGIRGKVVLAGVVGSVVALVNIIVTALLMFLSPHDLALLTVLLLFSLVVSLMFAYVVARSITLSIEGLALGAQNLAEGDLTTRLEASSDDEVGELARVMNTMAEELEQAFRRQRELEQARKDLIASVSHDLRTPLASMRAMVEAISDGVVSDELTIRNYCSNIRSEVEHLSKLIDDLFELSRLDSGTLDLHLQPSSVEEMLSSVLDSMKAQAEAQVLKLSHSLNGSLEPVMADPHQIQRVLYNLVQNAIRHTPADGTISVEAQDLGEEVQINVVDSGQGIVEDDVNKVFDRFYRGEKSRSREFGGAGLGLAIAKGIVEAHGGRIWVDSQPGAGSRFSFSLPKASTG